MTTKATPRSSDLILASAGELPEITFTCDVTIQAAAGGEAAGPPRFDMVAYAGGPLSVRGFPYPIIVDLAGLSGTDRARPILRDHVVERMVGHADSIVNDGRSLTASGVLSGVGADTREVLGANKNGFPWQASIGAKPLAKEFIPAGREVTVNGQTFAGPVLVSRKTHLKEISFTALGADESTSARIAATAAEGDSMTFEQWLAARGFNLADLSDEQKKSLQALYDADQAEDAGEGEAAASAAPGAPANASAASAELQANGAGPDISAYRAQLAAEHRRVADIQRLCGARHPTILASAIDGGWDATRTELEVLRADRPRAPVAGRGGAGGSNGAGGADAQVIEAAMCLAAGMSEEFVGEQILASDRERVMNVAVSRSYRGYSLHALMDAVILASGGQFNGSRRTNDFIRAAYEADQMIRAGGGTGFTTLSLSGTLSNVANKALIAAYDAVSTVWAMFCAVRNHGDFKVHTRYRLDSTGAFKKVGQDGELQQMGLSEASFTNQLATYGTIVSLTRQMQINDDMGAFLQLPQFLGRLAALRIEEAVFVLLLSNPSSFFHANNRNLMSGGTSALSIDAITTLEQKFQDQVDSNGKPILISPKVLLVPTPLKVTAENIYAEKLLITGENATKSARNPHAGKYAPVCSPYLNNTAIKDQSGAAITGQSSTAFYGFADPSVRAAMAVAFLNGQQSPTIESAQADFATLGMQWRAFHDFGVGMEDPVAAVKSAGA